MNVMKMFGCAAVLVLVTGSGAEAGEVGYDSTLGEIHTQVTHSYSAVWDSEYGGFVGQASQLVVTGSEILELLDPGFYSEEEWFYLRGILESAGAKAVLMDDPGQEETRIFIPFPSSAEPAVAIPARFQYAPGLWTEARGVGRESCEIRTEESGSQGTSVDCNCVPVDRRCCGHECQEPRERCQHCHVTTGRRWQLEDRFGPDPRWQHPRPFAEVEPGERLEMAVENPY